MFNFATCVCLHYSICDLKKNLYLLPKFLYLLFFFCLNQESAGILIYTNFSFSYNVTFFQFRVNNTFSKPKVPIEGFENSRL